MVTLIQLAAIAAILAGLLLLSSATECQVSAWNPWSPCLGTCLLSMRTRNRDVLRPPFPEIRDGKLIMEPCPSLYQVQQCVIPTCPVNNTDNNVDIFTPSELFNNTGNNTAESLRQLMNRLHALNVLEVTNNSSLERTEYNRNTSLTDEQIISETTAKFISHPSLSETLEELLKNNSTTGRLETTTVARGVEIKSTNNGKVQIFAPSPAPPAFAKSLPKVFLNTSNATACHSI